MSAYEAAVQAMADELRGEMADPFALRLTGSEPEFVARRCLAALVASEEVRAGLDDVIEDGYHPVNLILAALSPPA